MKKLIMILLFFFFLFSFLANGQVGIGTVNPAEMLEVNGNISGDTAKFNYYEGISSSSGNETWISDTVFNYLHPSDTATKIGIGVAQVRDSAQYILGYDSDTVVALNFEQLGNSLKESGGALAFPAIDSIYYTVKDKVYVNTDSNSVSSFRSASAYLPNWRKDFANAHYPEMVATENNANLAIIGDSYGLSVHAHLNKYAQRIYGYGGGYQPFIAGSLNSQGVYCFIGSGWVTGIDPTDAFILNSGYAESSTAGATLMIGIPYFNKLRLFYKQDAGGGTFSYQLGTGGTPINVSTSGEIAAKWCYHDFGSLKSNPADTVIIRIVSGSVRLYGFYLQNDYNAQISIENPRKLEIHNLAIGGTTVSNFVGKDPLAVKTLIDTLDISAFIMLWLDDDSEMPFSNYPAVIDELRAAKETTDYLILAPYNNENSLGRSQAKKYRALAQNLNVGYLDMSNLGGQYSKNNAAGLMADATHFNALGSSILFLELGKVLFQPTNSYEALFTMGLTVGHNSIIFPNSSSTYITNRDKRTNTGTNNASLGYSSMNANTTGSQNVAFGSLALEDLTSGSFNSAVGYNALASLTTATDNTAVGRGALATLTTAIGNSAFGSKALEKTTGQLNTGTGYFTLSANTVGTHNTAAGAGSLLTNISGSYNTAYGFSALRTNITGTSNVAIGYRSGWFETGDQKLYIANDSTQWANAPMLDGLLIYGDFNDNFVNIFNKLAVGSAQNPGTALDVTGSAVFSGYIKAGTGLIADNDSTPSIAGYNTFIYQGLAASATIVDLDDPVIGCYYTIIGNSDIYTVTIEDTGNFKLAGSSVVLGIDDVITLYCKEDNYYVEISRCDN